MSATDFTHTKARTLAAWDLRITKALVERDSCALRGLAFALDVTLPVFDGAALRRAQALKARAEAGARFVGGRHV